MIVHSDDVFHLTLDQHVKGLLLCSLVSTAVVLRFISTLVATLVALHTPSSSSVPFPLSSYGSFLGECALDVHGHARNLKDQPGSRVRKWFVVVLAGWVGLCHVSTWHRWLQL